MESATSAAGAANRGIAPARRPRKCTRLCLGRAHSPGAESAPAAASAGSGRSPEEIVADYPSLTLEDVQAALAYAAELAHERVAPIPPRVRRTRPTLFARRGPWNAKTRT